MTRASESTSKQNTCAQHGRASFVRRSLAALALACFAFQPVYTQDVNPAFIYTCQEPKQYALTFDDGPREKSTPKLLDMLSNEGVKATFFVLGVMLDNPAQQHILQDIYTRGHQVASRK